ncbi:MAG TPA: tRNA epoxyqueuosine(34) reductase QueG [Planctomycetota bacterium]|jgi:epoxyqueuosine reductase|nr:tRNA epoxyqueuosine(34) reductase QueG [Planctomycetota bacterium]
MSNASSIRNKALELGFEKIGFARAGAAPHGDALDPWLGQDFHGEMAWMARAPERRTDPGRLLPGARTIICVAKNYQSPGTHSQDPAVGRISRYAWGDDYHDVLLAKLHELREHIERLGGNAKVCVDTNAILEKPWAQEAGLGWQGKHSNLISREIGSWFFLGEVLTDLDLEADPPHRDEFCGTCTACIDLCPTKAIVAPYVVDSRRCIAYLTIEHRGSIPRELRPQMGNLVFGCDICQDVCPWNKFAQVAPEREFHARDGNLTPSLIGLLGMTREEFNRRFQRSPIKRAKYAGFLRNVAIALGNSNDPAAIPVLERALEHGEPLVRAHAAWALGRLGDRAALERRRLVESEAEVLEEIDAALSAR